MTPRGVWKREGEAVGDRVGHGYELDVERAYLPALAVFHCHEFGPVEHPRFLDTVAGQPEREL